MPHVVSRPVGAHRPSLLGTRWISRAAGKSQNHRLVEVGRHLWRPSGPTPLLQQGHLELVTQNHVQTAFEYLQGWRIHCPESEEEGAFSLGGRASARSCKVTGIAVRRGGPTMLPKSKARCTDLSLASLPTHLIHTFQHAPSQAFRHFLRRG